MHFFSGFQVWATWRETIISQCVVFEEMVPWEFTNWSRPSGTQWDLGTCCVLMEPLLGYWAMIKLLSHIGGGNDDNVTCYTCYDDIALLSTCIWEAVFANQCVCLQIVSFGLCESNTARGAQSCIISKHCTTLPALHSTVVSAILSDHMVTIE